MTTVMSTFAHHVWVARDMATEGAIAMYTVTPRRAGEQQRPWRGDSSSPTSTAVEVFALAERRMKKDPAVVVTPAEKSAASNGKGEMEKYGEGEMEKKETMEKEWRRHVPARGWCPRQRILEGGGGGGDEHVSRSPGKSRANRGKCPAIGGE